MQKPWIDGSKELLQHAEEHINQKSDFDRRIAFISIDNAVEVTIKAFLSLPKRIRNSDGPSKKELQDAENSFPTFLDLLEKYEANRIIGISLEDIEWFHRLRNQLYHGGNGITVDLAKVEAYFEIALTLFKCLFEEDIVFDKPKVYITKLGLFMERWTKYEVELRKKLPPKNNEYAYFWKRNFLSSIDESIVPIFNDVMNFRNNVVHGNYKPSEKELDEMIEYIKYLEEKLK